MSKNDAINSTSATQPEPAKPKGKPNATKAKSTKKTNPTKKSEPRVERANKKAEVIALM